MEHGEWNMADSEKCLYGKRVSLRPATLYDRESIYTWLAHSDLTQYMLGAPYFPDTPVPTWEEFKEDYLPYFFDGSEPLKGRCFVIEQNGTAIGQINYNDIYPEGPTTELDIWLSSSVNSGKEYGSDALITLCQYLYDRFGCKRIIIAPSKRNAQAIRAYEKAGFRQTTDIPDWFRGDYEDTIVMSKTLPSKI